MKEEEGKMITDWLDKHGNPKIEKLVEKQLMDKKTLEEASERFSDMCNGNLVSKYSFITGAKWQSERMYSEEDIKEAYKKGYADGQINTFTNIVNGGK